MTSAMARRGKPPAVALVGYGAIGVQLLRLLKTHGAGDWVVAVVEHQDRLHAARERLPEGVQVVSSLDEAIARRLDLVVECAGHRALEQHAARSLEAGVDVLVASVGALADAVLETALRAAAARGGSRVLIPSGALGGLDVLASARYAGLDEVTYISNKAPAAWRGTRAEQLVALDELREPTIFFEGNAREAALAFPQNANVAAAVALAGAGFERTAVKLTADREAKGNRHRIVARGGFGTIDMTVEGRTLPDNPKTSMLAPMSLLRAILARREALVLT